jgi:2-C-methyl-D-erythritol 4-phosphate cytidylyltransferase
VGEVWAIVVAAGRGDRFGAPKQFCELAGTRVVDRSVAVAAESCDAVVVVLPDGVAWDGPPVAAAVTGGPTRSASVRAGLDAIPDAAEIVVVHDAARPLATTALYRSVIDAIRDGADGAVPGVPVGDTVKQVDGARVVATFDREQLVAVQTPQAFRADWLRAAHRDAGDATDDAALLETMGATVVIVPGDVTNIKITAPSDLVVARALVEQR